MHMLQSSSAWGPFPELAAVYKHLSSVRGPNNGGRTLDGVSQVLRTGGKSFAWTSYMCSCYYTSGGSWPALLPGHNPGLGPACHLPAPLGSSQQRSSPASQVPASVVIPEMFQCCDHMQSSSSSCLFPRLHAFLCIHLGWISFHPVLSFLCSYSHQHASLAIRPCLPLSHLTVGCSISPLMLLV